MMSDGVVNTGGQPEHERKDTRKSVKLPQRKVFPDTMAALLQPER
jgi:hypothetical protein